MPRKIAGSEMITIELLIVAIRTPRVVFDSATHLYFGWSLSTRMRFVRETMVLLPKNIVSRTNYTL